MAAVIITPSEFKLGPGNHKFIRQAIIKAPTAAEVVKAGTLVFRDPAAPRLFGVARNEGIGGPLGTILAGLALADAAPGQPVDLVTEGIVDIGVSSAINVGDLFILAPFTGPVAGQMVVPGDGILQPGQFLSIVGASNGDSGGYGILLALASTQALGNF